MTKMSFKDVKVTLRSGSHVNASPRDISIPLNPYGGLREMHIASGDMWDGLDHINGSFRFPLDGIRRVELYEGPSEHEGRWRTLVNIKPEQGFSYRFYDNVANLLGKKLGH